MPRAKHPVRVAVALDWNAAYARSILSGIVRFARGRIWELTADRGDADGVIASPATVVADGVPTVCVSATPGNADVSPDAAAIGRMAADHFLERGFRHFACVGSVDDAFAHAVVAAGHALPMRLADDATLKALPRPVGCFAATDADAIALLRAARAAGVAVPHDLAMLGVGNDPALCELAGPSLSSIDLGLAALGHRAAARLNRLRQGHPIGPPERVPPLGVTLRQSTDTLAVDDSEVAAALRLMRQNTGAALRVGDLMRAADLDRRTLERRFRRAVGRSPAEALRRHRLDRAAELLRTTDQPIGAIAAAAGFRLPQHLAAAFRAIYGQTPSDYRATVRFTAE